MALAVAPPYDREAAAAHLARADRRLGRLIARVGPCTLTIPRHASPYEVLVDSIVSQQLHGRAAAAIYERLCLAFGRRRSPPACKLAAASDGLLRAAGLSRAKAAALRDLARRTVARQVPTRAVAERLADEELIAHLTEVRGVGRWTVEMLLIFGLGRPDVLPIDDFGVRRGFGRLYRLEEAPKPKDLLAPGERWRPYRSVAAWYLWRAAEGA